MGKEDQINLRELVGMQRTGLAAFRPDRSDPHVCADPREKNRISNDIHAVKIQENGGVPKPGGGDLARVPTGGSRLVFRAHARFDNIFEALADETRSKILGRLQCDRSAGGSCSG